MPRHPMTAATTFLASVLVPARVLMEGAISCRVTP